MAQQLDNPNTPVLENTGASRLTVFNPTESASTYSTALAAMDASRGKATGLPEVTIGGAHDSAPSIDKFTGKSNEDILKTLPPDQADFAKQALKDIPNGHIMEGMHPGEIAVGNWQMTKDEKQMLSQFTDQMIAQGKTHGQCTLPDGSVVDVRLVPKGARVSSTGGKSLIVPAKGDGNSDPTASDKQPQYPITADDEPS